MEMRYTVVLHSPLGERRGKLYLTLSAEEVQGSLTLLSHTTRVAGTCTEGICLLTGELHTLLHSIPWQGEGRLDSKSLDLRLHGLRGSYRLTGVAEENA